MLSRVARAACVSRPTSILFRCVTTSANKGAEKASAVASTEQRRFPHDAPERDFVNFPPLRIPEEAGKLRIGLVPDNWFKAMYDKTGVTGPYILFWGAIATLLSKEYLIYWVDSSHHLIFLAFVIGVSKAYGHKIGAALDKLADTENKSYSAGLENASKVIDEKITKTEALQSLPEANKIIHAAKRENIHLQLESAYRQRLAQLFQEVKKRLDYQAAIQNVYKRLEREEAINYIIGQTQQAIGPNQEKEAFQSGISQLKLLSKKYAGSI